MVIAPCEKDYFGIAINSTIGPSDRAGRKVRAPTIRMTPVRRTAKRSV
jgi:hypothetical protein